MLNGLLAKATRYLFFTGKGGVGKTSLSSATAVALADRGHRVLLVSTDPASNLQDVFGIPLGGQPTAVVDAPGLWAADIDPEAAARRVRERTVAPFRGAVPDEEIRRMEEELSGACSTEVAAFDELVRLLVEGPETAPFDHVIFDTAPTGHTLRLLALPAAWDGFLRENTSGASCLGPLAALGEKRQLYAQAVATLRDPAATSLVLVTRPESSAIVEAERTRAELVELGIGGLRLVVNGELAAPDVSDPIAVAYAEEGRKALAAMPSGLRVLQADHVPLRPFEAMGIEALRQLLAADVSEPVLPAPTAGRRATSELPPIGVLVDQLEAKGKGLVMVMGKGGVGKTTLAAAIALELARRGHPVKLSTTDPAAHLESTLEAGIPGLEMSRIDPHMEKQRYVEHVLATKGAGLDPAAKALLEEDLRSPCTEEIAVFSAFSHLLRESRRSFVVLDTAPTGHTLLLLDATGAYHRDILRKVSGKVGRLRTPLDMLRDPELSHVLIVALPQSTPVSEAERLEADLRRAGIAPWAWVLNRSLAATEVHDPVLSRLAAAELQHIARVHERVPRIAIVPWQVEAPRGAAHLAELMLPPVSSSTTA